MQPTAHLASTYIVWWVIRLFFGADSVSLLLAIVFGVLVDLDAVVLGSKHRVSPLHSIGYWFLAIIIAFLFGWVYWWTLLFGILHLSMDMIDYRVSIFYPFVPKLVGLGYAERRMSLVPGKNSLLEFSREYMKIKPLFISEVVLVGVFIFLVFYDPSPVVHVFLMFFGSK